MAEAYRFDNEQTAIDAEQWLCDKASELGMGFSGVTKRWAIPRAELDENEEPTGYWTFPRVPVHIIERMDESDIVVFMTTFAPEIVEV